MKENLDDFTVVVTKNQTEGRGQMGTVWQSEAAKNLTFSVYKQVGTMDLEYPFYISMVSALAVLKALRFFSVPKLTVKWPNDILSENKKLCGILIENIVRQNRFAESVIGIGLNVNQLEFSNLPQASSLMLVTGRVFDLDEVLSVIIKQLKYYFKALQAGEYEALKRDYESHLFRKDKPSTFKDEAGLVFSGFIKKVSESGNLQILLEDNIVKEYSLKEVSLLY